MYHLPRDLSLTGDFMDQQTQTGVERLLASRSEFVREVEARGAQIGRAWALERADYGALLDVAALDPADRELSFASLSATLDRQTPGEGDRILGQFAERLVRLGLPVEGTIGFVEAVASVRALVEDAANDRRAAAA